MRGPTVSNLELTNRCNFKCGYCQNQHSDGKRKIGDMPVEMVETLIKEQAFDNTLFMELQLNGEPTLHPQFMEIVSLVKERVRWLGMSTNGTWIGDENIERAVTKLNLVTVSIHEQTDEKKFRDVVGFLRKERVHCRMQTLNGNTYGIDLPGLVTDGVVLDDFHVREFGKQYIKKVSCLDLFTSVAVQWDGDVVPCCNVVGKQKVLGNLKHEMLQWIWAGFDNKVFPYCNTCASPSPIAFRYGMLAEFMKWRK